MSDDKIKELENYAFNMRRHALTMSYAAGSHAAHFGGGMSMIDILAVLYGDILNLDKNNSLWEERDRFILSKGHGVIGYYAALAEYGYIPLEDLNLFEQKNSYLMGHPIKNPEHGIEFTNGSLGMGLSLGIGTALAARIKAKEFKTVVLMGDGECDEGSVWEGVMAAAHFHLDNLCAVIDRNGLQLGGNTEDVMSQGNMGRKFEAFGWNVFDVDGHDIQELYQCFKNIPKNQKPTMIVANTIKGKGFSFSENNNAWHHSVLTLSQYESAMKELEESFYGN